MQFPYFYPVMGQQDRFTDFFDVNKYISQLDPYSESVSYPPFGIFVAFPFSQLADYLQYSPKEVRDSNIGLISIILFEGPFLLFLGWFIYQAVKGQGWVKDGFNTLSLLITLPVIFLLDRGNYVILTFICLALFFFYYDTRKDLSLFSLAAAISMKIYPVIYLVLLLMDRRFKDLIKIVFCVFIFSIFPLVVFKQSVFTSLKYFLSSIAVFSSGPDRLWVYLSYNLSMDTLLKYIGFFWGVPISEQINIIYFVFKSLLITLCIFLLFFEKNNWKRVLILTLIMILMPSMSMEYNLIYIYLPVYLFLISETNRKTDQLYLVVFTLLLIIKPYYVFQTGEIVRAFTIQPMIEVLTMFSVLFFYLIINFRKILCGFYHPSF